MTRYFRSRFVNISNNQIYTALDIGSGKISCLIAKINNSGQIEIIGAGHQESKGLSVGTITDLKDTLLKRKKESEYEIDGLIITSNNLNDRNKDGNPKYNSPSNLRVVSGRVNRKKQ